MIKITDIKVGKSKIKLTLSDGQILSITPDTQREFLIYTGKDLSPEDVLDIKQYEAEIKHLNYVYNLLARGSYSQKEVDKKLQKREVGSQERTSIIDKLIANNFLNDERYARERINYLIKYKQSSLRFIESDLRTKGIDKFLITDLISELPELEVEQIQKKLPKLIKRYQKESIAQAKMKINKAFIFLGFKRENIEQVLSAVELSDYINEDDNIANAFNKILKKVIKADESVDKVVYNKLAIAGYPHYKIKQIIEEKLNEN